jgi:hypothetical protein
MKDKIQNMNCEGCKQSAINCSKCIRKIMDNWEVYDYYTTEKVEGVLYFD